MTRNICLDNLRHKKKTGCNEDEVFIQDILRNEPVREMENMEASLLIKKIINELDEPYKSAIILRDIEGLTYEESAEITGSAINTLRVNLSRARKMVREKMTIIYSYGSERYKGIAL